MPLEAIRPRAHHRVMDLVADAGIDVSDWANFKGGAAKAATNPKYCYEWAFVQPGVVAVLNIWFEKMQEQDGEIFQELNLRRDSLETTNSVWARRAQHFDAVVQRAWREKLPLRVIVCDGMMREGTGPDVEASHVKNRLLDPEPWSVAAYDWMSGASRISRAEPKIEDASAVEHAAIEPASSSDSRSEEIIPPAVDQFDIAEAAEAVAKRTVEATVFERSAEVRRRVLRRANGCCEYCDEAGFLTAAGAIYLETHHVVPLSEDGPDTVTNVVALCAKHHREAHFGAQRDALRTKLLTLVAGKT